MTSAIANTSIPQDSGDLSSIFTEDVSRSLLDFWFGDSSLYPTQEEGARWFRPDPEFDEQCRSKFASVLSKVAAHPPSAIIELATSPERALALLLLLDQIPRNIFRGELSAKVYTETDPLAVAVSLHSISPALRYDWGPNNAWKTVPSRRVWFHLPLSHSEDPKLHERVVGEPGVLEDCLEEEASKGECAGLAMARILKTHTEEHKSVIDKFGRYPYRNKVLGRENTQEETIWLENSNVRWAR